MTSSDPPPKGDIFPIGGLPFKVEGSTVAAQGTPEELADKSRQAEIDNVFEAIRAKLREDYNFTATFPKDCNQMTITFEPPVPSGEPLKDACAALEILKDAKTVSDYGDEAYKKAKAAREKKQSAPPVDDEDDDLAYVSPGHLETKIKKALRPAAEECVAPYFRDIQTYMKRTKQKVSDAEWKNLKEMMIDSQICRKPERDR